MKIFDKALGAVGLARKSVTINGQFYPVSAAAQSHIGGVGHAGAAVTPRSSLGLSAVWACAHLVAGTTSSLPFELRRKTADGVAEVASDHPVHAVLYDSPNYDQTPLDFWDHMSLSIELWGNAYARISRNGAGRVVALYPIMPEAMAVTRLTNGRIQYRWTDEGKGYESLEQDVLHIRGPGGSPLGGMSTLAFGMQSISTALATEQAAASTFANGMRPSMWVAFKDWLTDEQRAVAEVRMAERYQGAMNAGRPFITEGGTELKPVSLNPEEAQMLETRQFAIEEICRFFQVPPALIGHAGASTAWPSSVDQQMLMFLKFYLRRRVKRIEQAVSKQLLSTADRAAGYSARINMDGLLRGDSAARATFYQTMAQIGALTINEIRAMEGRRPVPGGNEPRMQSQNIPITATESLNNG